MSQAASQIDSPGVAMALLSGVAIYSASFGEYLPPSLRHYTFYFGIGVFIVMVAFELGIRYFGDN